MNRVQKEVILHGVRWARNILVEVVGNHSRKLGKESHKCLRTAITALTDFDHAMGAEHPEEPVKLKTPVKVLKAFVMEARDQNGDELRVVIGAEKEDDAHVLFEKEYGALLDEPGAWSSTEVPLAPGILKL